MAPYLSRTACCMSDMTISCICKDEYTDCRRPCYICQYEYMSRPVSEMENLLKALADETRLRILGLLLTGEVCVCDIHESLKIPQPKASRHLAYLRRAGLVAARRDGLWMHYRLAPLADPLVAAIGDTVRHALAHTDI